MLNRRQLRIKAMEIVYCFSNSTQNELEKHLEVFKNSTDKFLRSISLTIFSKLLGNSDQ